MDARGTYQHAKSREKEGQRNCDNNVKYDREARQCDRTRSESELVQKHLAQYRHGAVGWNSLIEPLEPKVVHCTRPSVPLLAKRRRCDSRGPAMVAPYKPIPQLCGSRIQKTKRQYPCERFAATRMHPANASGACACAPATDAYVGIKSLSGEVAQSHQRRCSQGR